MARSFASERVKDVLRSSTFWRENLRLGAVVCLCGVGAGLILVVTWGSQVGVLGGATPGAAGAYGGLSAILSLVMNALILATLVMGLVRAVVHVAELRIYRDFARVTSKESADAGAAQKSATEVLPSGQDVVTAVRAVFDRVYTSSRGRNVESASRLTQTCREDCMRKLHSISEVPRVSLQIGILGTFLGLALSMVAVQQTVQLLGGAPEVATASAHTRMNELTRLLLGSALPQLYGALFVSFSSSVSGLIAALSVGALMQPIRRGQSEFLGSLDDAVAVYQDFVLRKEPERNVSAELRGLEGRLHELTEETRSGDARISTALEDSAKKTEAVARDIVRSTTQLGKGQVALTEALDKTAQAHMSYAETVDASLKKAVVGTARYLDTAHREQLKVIKNLATDQERGLSAALGRIEAGAEAAASVLEATVETQGQLLKRVGAFYEQAEARHQTSLEQTRQRADDAMVSLQESLQRSAESQAELFAEMSRVYKAAGLAAPLAAMTDRLRRLETDQRRQLDSVQSQLSELEHTVARAGRSNPLARASTFGGRGGAGRRTSFLSRLLAVVGLSSRRGGD